MELAITILQQRRETTEAKIATRKDTFRTKHINAMAAQLSSAMVRGDFLGMVPAATEGGKSLDYEDYQTCMTPLQWKMSLLLCKHSASMTMVNMSQP